MVDRHLAKQKHAVNIISRFGNEFYQAINRTGTVYCQLNLATTAKITTICRVTAIIHVKLREVVTPSFHPPSVPKNNLWGWVLLFWHAPLGVRSTIRRHQPPQRAVLSQFGCFIQCEVVGSQALLDSVQPRDTGTPWWSLPILWWGAIRITLASASSSIRTMCPNMERCCDWIIAVRSGCLVIFLTSSLRTNWCHLIPSGVLKYHWSRRDEWCWFS